jgi:hypothetical protein
MSKNIPSEPKLWNRIQKLVRGDVSYIIHDSEKIHGPNKGTGFKKHPSAYSNGWAAKLYKRLGGRWKKSRKANFDRIAVRIANLDDWFNREDWVAIDTTGKIVGPCAQSHKRETETREGQDPIKCLPRAKAESMTKSERASAARRKKRLEKERPDRKKPVHAPTKPKR